MASGTLKLHRRIAWKSFSFELHSFMTAETQLPLRLQPRSLWNEKLVTGRAVKTGHASDVDPSLAVTFDAVFGFRFHGM